VLRLGSFFQFAVSPIRGRNQDGAKFHFELEIIAIEMYLLLLYSAKNIFV
jgi:hypothetical protein